jgi:hypothetical protein
MIQGSRQSSHTILPPLTGIMEGHGQIAVQHEPAANIHTAYHTLIQRVNTALRTQIGDSQQLEAEQALAAHLLNAIQTPDVKFLFLYKGSELMELQDDEQHSS